MARRSENTNNVRPSYPAVVPVKVEVVSRKQVFLVVDVGEGESRRRFASLKWNKNNISTIQGSGGNIGVMCLLTETEDQDPIL